MYHDGYLCGRLQRMEAALHDGTGPVQGLSLRGAVGISRIAVAEKVIHWTVGRWRGAVRHVNRKAPRQVPELREREAAVESLLYWPVLPLYPTPTPTSRMSRLWANGHETAN